MSKDVYIYSTLSCPNNYPVWKKAENGIARIEKNIFINGGSGVVNRKQLYTPLGVVTKVSEEDYALLKESRHFQAHVEKGFLKVRDEKLEPKKVVTEGMETKDASAQLVPEDFAESEPKPASSKKKGKKDED